MPDQQPLHPAPTPLRCRCLTVKGFQCKHPALFGHDLCYHHFHNRRPTLPPPEQASAPFLDDPASIQLLLTQIAHGLLSRQLPADIARALSYTCQVAMNTLPRPLAPRFKPSGEKPRLDEPILAVVPADNGEPLAPSQKYAGPTGTFEPTWSVSKFFYEQECERLQQKIPTSADEYPASGWLTEEEMRENPADFTARYQARKRKLRIRAGEYTAEDLQLELEEVREKDRIEEEAHQRSWTHGRAPASPAPKPPAPSDPQPSYTVPSNPEPSRPLPLHPEPSNPAPSDLGPWHFKAVAELPSRCRFRTARRPRARARLRTYRPRRRVANEKPA